MKLSLKFALITALLLFATSAVSAWVLIQHQEKAMQDEVRQRALTVLSFGEACRAYTNKQLRPKINNLVKKHQEEMVFEAQSATFVARGTFEELRQRLPEYSFREASLNPLNLVNRASPEEERLIRQFAVDPELKEVTGFAQRYGREYFYVARPIRVEKRCLECHHSPETAPPDVVARYGSQHGYGWKEGEANSALLVSVPSQDIREQQVAIVWKVGGTFAGAGVILFGAIYFLFEFLVNRRLRRAAAVMGQVAAGGSADARLDDKNRDELGVLAEAFNSMSGTLHQSQVGLEERVRARTVELARANEKLEEEARARQRVDGEAQRARAMAEAADNAKSQFLARTSQQVRGPLHEVLRSLDRLQKSNPGGTPPEAVQQAAASANAALTLIDDLNDFAQLEVGNLQVSLVEFDLRHILERAVKGPAARAATKGIKLSTDLGPDTPLLLSGDPLRLRQVLFSLVDNAVKFTSRGEVKVRVAVEGRVERSVRLRFDVSDTGIGIPGWKKEALFEPDTDEEGREAGGIGLGLRLGSRLVELMGGRLQVESQLGQGSAFFFTLPFTVVTQPRQRLSHQGVVSPSGLRQKV
jgi:signal transduction histidine kinase